MRSAGNFSPEWGYLAPAPSFMRTARIVLVATAIGATAGAGVVLSLVDHPAAEGERASVAAAHAIVTSAQAATSPLAPRAGTARATGAAPKTAAIAPLNAAPNVSPPARDQTPQLAAQPAPQAQTPAPLTTAPLTTATQPSGETDAAGAAKSAPGMAALSPATTGATPSDATPSDAPSSDAIAAPEQMPLKKTKHSGAGPTASNGKSKTGAGLGTMLRHLFSAHAGTSYYPNR